MKFLYLLLVSFLVACATPAGGPSTDPQQQVIDLTFQSYTALRAAIQAADAAVLAGKLKGQDAQNVLAGLKSAELGLDATLAALPPKGATK